MIYTRIYLKRKKRLASTKTLRVTQEKKRKIQ